MLFRSSRERNCRATRYFCHQRRLATVVSNQPDGVLSGSLGTEGSFGWNGRVTCYYPVDPPRRFTAVIWAHPCPNAEFERDSTPMTNLYIAMLQPAGVKAQRVGDRTGALENL